MNRPADDEAPREQREICVMAPWPILTVTIEAAAEGRDGLYLHAGGQAFWVARMILNLGQKATLCGPFGGETGLTTRFLAESEGVATLPIEAAGWNGAYVHDRRSGKREELARIDSPALNRHEADDFYTAVFTAGLACGHVVLTGIPRDDMLPPDMHRRLARDLDANGVAVVADVSGAVLRSLEGGLQYLKVSHQEMIDAGLATDAGTDALLRGIETLQGVARNIVISRAEDGALAWLEGRVVEARAPTLSAHDHTGAGDSMTAALAVAHATGLAPEHALRLSVAAGAINVMRRGRGTGGAARILEMAEHVALHPHRGNSAP